MLNVGKLPEQLGITRGCLPCVCSNFPSNATIQSRNGRESILVTESNRWVSSVDVVDCEEGESDVDKILGVC